MGERAERSEVPRPSRAGHRGSSLVISCAGSVANFIPARLQICSPSATQTGQERENMDDQLQGRPFSAGHHAHGYGLVSQKSGKMSFAMYPMSGLWERRATRWTVATSSAPKTPQAPVQCVMPWLSAPGSSGVGFRGAY